MNRSVRGLQEFSKKPGWLLLRNSARQVATWPIVAYQYTLSPDHGPTKVLYPYGYCRFYPSCSEYCRRSVLKDGIALGYLKGGWRILRCNPFSAGGVDEP